MRFNGASNSLRYQCVTAERRKDSDLLWLQNLRLCSRFTQIVPVLVTCEATGNCGTSPLSLHEAFKANIE